MEGRLYDLERKMERRLKNTITKLDVDIGLISKHILQIDEAGYGREHGWKKTETGETEWEEAYAEEDTGEVAEENKQTEEEQEKENENEAEKEKENETGTQAEAEAEKRMEEEP